MVPRATLAQVMPKPPARSKRNYRSPMERYPKYVHALGMISIENSSLESCLGELLGIILGIHPHIGHTLYFTPRAAIARLDLIENVINDSIGDDEALSKRVRAVVKALQGRNGETSRYRSLALGRGRGSGSKNFVS